MKRKVAVAMSGGVDSSVAAAVMKAEGHEVVGITMRLWGEEQDSGPMVASAAEVCATLGIEHKVLDLRETFGREIIDYFLDSYVSGLTPNPCVRCNGLVKFGVLMKLVDLVRAERLATGHYARVLLDGRTGRYNLMRALDEGKDQSYFLYRLDQKQLAFSVFPVGEMTKDEVRDRARRLGLPSSEREESQEVCFIPDNDYRGLIESERPDAVREGDFVDTDGSVIGRHRGVAFYTVGQRRGLGFSSPLGRRYVVARDVATNRVTLGSEHELMRTSCLVGELNWVAVPGIDAAVTADVKLRYRSTPVRATLVPEGENVRAILSAPFPGISPGQSAVFYDGDTVLGGGIIQ
ncbi:MAG TPA: tRNA 2-thiouridine(34) synthase MnmA [Nitrospirota bacterium]|nr:tRNA 2-thiouridine(34) synthase MnmA [Nitrospirota bacterium]